MTTQYATASYQEIIDLHTESDTVSVIGIHTPVGVTPQRMLKGFWTQFKKFKYNGCSVSLVPAARLPADPSQVSYAAGEPPIDPRDLLNPILFHGCHGDDMGNILNSLYSGALTGSTGNEVSRSITDSINFDVFNDARVGNDYVEALYYKALTDNTWAKAHPQRGFRKSGLRPMIYNVATNFQFGAIPYGDFGPNDPNNRVVIGGNGAPNSGASGSMGVKQSGSNLGDIGVLSQPDLPFTDESGDDVVFGRTSTRSGIRFFTPGLRPLGWMETRQVIASNAANLMSTVLSGSAASDSASIGGAWASKHLTGYEDVQVPKIFMGMILLPPAYKTEQYFRMILNHSFSFKSFRGASFMNDSRYEINNVPQYTNLNGITAPTKGVTNGNGSRNLTGSESDEPSDAVD